MSQCLQQINFMESKGLWERERTDSWEMYQPTSVWGPYLSLDLNKWNVETIKISVMFDIYEAIWNPDTDQIFDIEEWVLIFKSLSRKLCGYVKKDLLCIYWIFVNEVFKIWDSFQSYYCVIEESVGIIDETRLSL